jgi:hypothetical protein
MLLKEHIKIVFGREDIDIKVYKAYLIAREGTNGDYG